MDKTELEAYVVQALGKGKGRDEILTFVCEHGGMKWQEADLFVLQVVEKLEPDIAKRRKGIIIILGIIGIIGGIIVIIGIVYAKLSKPDPALSERPSCVTLPVYSSVIEQMEGIYPYWSPLQATHDGFVTLKISTLLRVILPVGGGMSFRGRRSVATEESLMQHPK